MLHCALGGLGDNSFPCLFPASSSPLSLMKDGLVMHVCTCVCAAALGTAQGPVLTSCVISLREPREGGGIFGGAWGEGGGHS